MSGAITILEPVARDVSVVFFAGDETVDYRHVATAGNPAPKRPWSVVGQRLVGGIPFMKNLRHPRDRQRAAIE
jgi:hypothetical protein